MGVIFKHQELEFESLETPTYKLSAIVGADSFFYAIEEQKADALVYLETYQPPGPLALFADPLDFISDLMAGNPLLFEPFAVKKIAFSGIPYTIVSRNELIGTSPVRLLSRVTNLAALDEVRVHLLPNLDAGCVFAIPRPLVDEIEMYFDDPEYLHLAGCLLNWFEGQDPSADIPRIHLHHHGNQIFMMGRQNGKTVFHNQFHAEHVSDTLYFLVAVVDLMQLAGAEFHLSVSGQRRKEILDDETFSAIFGKTLTDIKAPRSWPAGANEFLDLSAISRCGS